MTITRKRFRVSGIVQGVGFRPFVWRIANELGCTGHVCNDASGVSIEVQAAEECIDAFQIRLQSDAPPAARIKHVAVEQIANVSNESGFAIIESRLAANIAAWVAPDLGVCDDCLNELRDPTNRRYGYPFINCTACGPRFTIIDSLPYDRSRTTMRHFELCADCRTEYESPDDRRFHAEPNACSLCGPTIWFASSHDGEFDADRPRTLHGSPNLAAERIRTVQVLKEVRGRVAAGEIVAVRGIGGFHLVCDATNVDAVQRLRVRKHRPHKPFAVMISDLENCELLSKIGRQERELLRSSEQPIVLIEKNALVRTSSNVDAWIEAVAPKNPCLGVMLAYSPLHHLLIPSDQGMFTVDARRVDARHLPEYSCTSRSNSRRIGNNSE